MLSVQNLLKTYIASRSSQIETKPTYKISVSEKEGINEIVITGVVTEDFFEKLQHEVNVIVESTNARKLLADVSALQVPRVFSEAYSRIIINYPPLLRAKTALVDVPENAEFQSFHETMVVNAGLSFKWFTDIDAAKACLNKQIKNACREAISNRH